MYPTQVIPNFLSREHLAQIGQWQSQYDPGSDVVPAPIGRYTDVDPRTAQLIDSLVDHVPHERLFIRMMEATSSGGVHADNGRLLPSAHSVAPPLFARTFIIPLTDLPTHTILFNQAMPLDVDLYDYMQGLPQLDPREAVGQAVAQRLLSHVGSEWLSKLSIDVVFPWRAGDLLVFDRNRLHSSDNWKATGLEAKQGFVIWSEIHP